MAPHVLVPYDDPELAAAALEHALTEFSAGEITVLHVFEPEDNYDGTNTAVVSEAETEDESLDEDDDSILSRARKRAISQDRTLLTARTAGDRPNAVHEYAAEHDVDHIVVGGRERDGESQFLEQQLADDVASGSPVPVTIV